MGTHLIKFLSGDRGAADKDEEALLSTDLGYSKEVEKGKYLGRRKFSKVRLAGIMGLIAILLTVVSLFSLSRPGTNESCESVEHGYQCSPELSHFWGQYSPYFQVPSDILAPKLPKDCVITFVQALSRHGARFPTASKSKAYNATISKIQSSVTSFQGNLAFLANYTYSLGADDLTTFGEEQMSRSGTKFYNTYEHLAKDGIPFIRSSGESRVVESAAQFAIGYGNAKKLDPSASNRVFPSVNVIISEDANTNNTLSHSLCTDFENRTDNEAQSTWAAIFLPSILDRLDESLAAAKLTSTDIINLMDLCPFETVAASSVDNGYTSPFCSLFTNDEWHEYDYYQSLGKWYDYGPGGFLGPTQGVGFSNELIARLTDKPVSDHTSTNRTLDADRETFPLGRNMYADFSHDNDMTSIFAALGLYSSTKPLPSTMVKTARDNRGYSASLTVPFAARAYFEKMKCSDEEEELVRILVNDRIIPLTLCRGDRYGRCGLGSFINSLSFAREGGLWDQCFV